MDFTKHNICAVFACCAAAFAISLRSNAEPWVWTGAVNGCWTNPANWTVGGAVPERCPGACSNQIFAVDGSVIDGWTNSVPVNDTVEFGVPAAGGATTIDLDGHYFVGSVTFKAGCPEYTLGTSSSQVFALGGFGASETDCSSFTIERGASMPKLVAGFSMGAANRNLQRDGYYYSHIAIRNNTDGKLVFGTFGHSRNPGMSNVSRYNVYFFGTGGYRFAGPVRGVEKHTQSLYQYAFLHFRQRGKVYISTPLFGRGCVDGALDPDENRGPVHIEIGGECTEMVIDEGCRLAFSDWNDPTLVFKSSVKVTGGGMLQLCVQGWKGIDGNYGSVAVKSGCIASIETPLSFYDCDLLQNTSGALRFKAGVAGWLSDGYRGTFHVRDSNDFSGDVWFFDPVAYRADSVAGFGTCEKGNSAYLKVDGTFDYAGAGNETFSRSFRFCAKNCAATVRNSGRGLLTVSSVFSPTNVAASSGASVVLDAQTAPIAFTGGVSVPDGAAKMALVKGGSDILSLSADADLTGASSLRISGGVVDLSARSGNDGTLDFPLPVTFDTGACSLRVSDGTTLLLPSVSATDSAEPGSLDIEVGVNGCVKVSGKSSGDAVPAGVTVNGFPAAFGDDGALVPAYDAGIAARGDVVPNAPNAQVAIVREGSGGADTLEAANTAVGELRHMHSSDATVAIGENRTFSAGRVTVGSTAGNLAIGEAGDTGLFRGDAAGSVTFANQSRTSVLTVNAEIGEGTEVRVDGTVGEIRAAGGASSEVDLHVSDGALTLTGDSPFRLGKVEIGTNCTANLDATLVVDGTVIQLGEDPLYVGSGHDPVVGQKSVGRLVVTNALVRNVDDEFTPSYTAASTNKAICVGVLSEGVMEICDGAVITNRLLVGGVYYNDTKTRAGAVYQTGGEMAAIGGQDSGSVYGSSIGMGEQHGIGYYELRGGKFTMLGSIAIGYYGRGSFVQFGGHSVFTNNPWAESWRTPTFGPISTGNGGNATMRFVGGTSEIHGALTLTGGWTNNGKSRLTVEDGAEVDAGQNAVKVVGGPNRTYINTADLVLAGGILRAAGFYCGRRTDYPNSIQVYTIGFDGGTFKTSSNDKDVFHASVGEEMRAATNVIVYAGGMTVDTDGKTGNRTSVSIRKAYGGGVMHVPFTPVSGLVAAPIVSIEGDGFGAVAVAEFDSSTGTMTGVKVIAPGVGYTAATAAIWKDTTTKSSAACEIADNDGSGAFTKSGEGDFTLSAPGGWGGETVLRGGTLRLGVDGALPNGTKVVYCGGTLAVADGISLPDELDVSIANIDRGRRYTLATIEGETSANPPAIYGLDDPRWQARIVGNRLSLSFVRGMVVTVR